MLLGMIVDRHEFDAMLFPHTRVIHTFCMRFPIDVIFVSKNMEIVEVATKIRPNRVISGPKGTSFVLETISVARNVDRDISVGAKIKIDFI
jgi:uncharacterized membrane protein (UPF0127 family)